MAYETIIYEKEADGIAVLTFNRPEVLNAGNSLQYEELHQAIDEATNDDEVRALILTGAGRGFHAGDDVKRTFLDEDWTKKRMQSKLNTLVKGKPRSQFFRPFFKPLISAVNGACVGAGFDFALSSDVRIGTPNAKFGYFFVRRGMIGGDLALQLLPHILGLSRALEMMMSGELIDADEALNVGLIKKIVPQENLLDEARALARKFTQAAPLAQQAVKRCVLRSLRDPANFADFSYPIGDILMETEDHIEGSKAFAEKRPAVYKGR